MTEELRAAFAEERDKFVAENPDIETLEVLLTDSAGTARGKWFPADALRGIEEQGVHLPISIFGETIWSTSTFDESLGLFPSDPDGFCLPVPGTLRRIPWRARPSAQVLLTMFEADRKTPHLLDSRQVLSSVQRRFHERGLFPVAATEFEFCLFRRDDANRARTRPRQDEKSISRLYELDELQDASPVLDDIRTFADAQRIPITALVTEMAPRQFELNLGHVRDACRAGDLAIQFKRLVKQVAVQHGFDTTFMAKPWSGRPGNGCHVHISLTDEDGCNAFDEQEASTAIAGPKLLSAVTGCMETALDFQLVFAPHANSYKRFQAGNYAPVRICWGYDHRGASIRIPERKGASARLEHRIAGADAQPYLLLAAVLGGMLEGMERGAEPAPPVDSGGRDFAGEALTPHWQNAIERFSNSEVAARVLGQKFRQLYAQMKKSEQDELNKRITDVEYEIYFRKS